MVVFDATILMLLLRPDVPTARDPITQRPMDRAKDRIEHLVACLEKSKTRILIPTPVLSEVLVHAGESGPRILEILNTTSAFRVVPFDQRAAVEVAALTQSARATGDKREGGAGTWAKIKYDRQIIAMARVEQAVTIYSDDDNIRRFATPLGIEVIGIADLPLPPEDPQLELGIKESGDPSNDEKDD